MPERQVSNDDLARRVDTSREWISAKTGIEERRISAPDRCPSDMACRAAERCLVQAGVDKSEVDLIIVASASSTNRARRSVPGSKIRGRGDAVPGLRRELGLRGVRLRAFRGAGDDACFAQAIPSRAGHRSRRVLKILNWDDRRTCVYFGDGAGAVLLSQTNTSHSQMHFQLGSDGRGSHHIEVPAGAPACPSTRRCSRAGLTSSRSMARRCRLRRRKWFPRPFVRFSDSTTSSRRISTWSSCTRATYE